MEVITVLILCFNSSISSIIISCLQNRLFSFFCNIPFIRVIFIGYVWIIIKDWYDEKFNWDTNKLILSFYFWSFIHSFLFLWNINWFDFIILFWSFFIAIMTRSSISMHIQSWFFFKHFMSWFRKETKIFMKKSFFLTEKFSFPLNILHSHIFLIISTFSLKNLFFLSLYSFSLYLSIPFLILLFLLLISY